MLFPEIFFQGKSYNIVPATDVTSIGKTTLADLTELLLRSFLSGYVQGMTLLRVSCPSYPDQWRRSCRVGYILAAACYPWLTVFVLAPCSVQTSVALPLP